MKTTKKYLLLIPLFILAVITCIIVGYKLVSLMPTETSNVIVLDPQDEDGVIINDATDNGNEGDSDNTIGNDSETDGENTSTNDNINEADNENTTGDSEDGDDVDAEGLQEVSPDSDIDVDDLILYADEDGEFSIISHGVLWEQYTEIDIFNGLDIVAPGSNGEFLYTLANDKDYDIEYAMEIDSNEDDTKLIPLQFRLRLLDGDYYGTGEWISAEELEDVTEIVDPGDSISYVLEWKWEYETGEDEDDAYDTMLGESDLLEYTMTIKITATGDVETSASGYIKTGDDSNVTILLFIVVTAILAIGVLLVVRHNSKEKENKDEEIRKQ